MTRRRTPLCKADDTGRRPKDERRVLDPGGVDNAVVRIPLAFEGRPVGTIRLSLPALLRAVAPDDHQEYRMAIAITGTRPNTQRREPAG